MQGRSPRPEPHPQRGLAGRRTVRPPEPHAHARTLTHWACLYHAREVHSSRKSFKEAFAADEGAALSTAGRFRRIASTRVRGQLRHRLDDTLSLGVRGAAPGDRPVSRVLDVEWRRVFPPPPRRAHLRVVVGDRTIRIGRNCTPKLRMARDGPSPTSVRPHRRFELFAEAPKVLVGTVRAQGRDLST